MELLNRIFTAQSVAMATGVSPRAITNWTGRNLLIGQRPARGKGHRIQFTFFNVMEVAVADALIKVGVSSVQDAIEAAQGFSHMAPGRSGWAGEQPAGPMRLPGLPYHHRHGVTGLFVFNGGSSVRLIDDDGQIDLWTVTPEASRVPGFIFLNVSRAFEDVCARLALHPDEVLDEAYPKDG